MKNNIWHILPCNDIKPHFETNLCHCNPKLEVVNGNLLVIHNSFDGREIIEWTNKILNQTP